MSDNWVLDVEEMHSKMGFYSHMYEKVAKNNLIREFIEYRLNFIQEELNEGYQALKDKEPEEIVDALIDICVVAITTLDLLEVNPNKAWNEVMRANLQKELGIKEGRPNPLGLPDMKKPKDFIGPDHGNNIGYMDTLRMEV